MATLIGVSPAPVEPGGYAPHPLEIFANRLGAQDWTKGALWGKSFRPTNTNPDGSPINWNFGGSPGPVIGGGPVDPRTPGLPGNNRAGFGPWDRTIMSGAYTTGIPNQQHYDNRAGGPPARVGEPRQPFIGGYQNQSAPQPAPVTPTPAPTPAPVSTPGLSTSPVGAAMDPRVSEYFPGTPMPGQSGWYQGQQGMVYRPWNPMGSLSWNELTDYWNNKTFTPEQLYGLATGFSGYPGRRY